MQKDMVEFSAAHNGGLNSTPKQISLVDGIILLFGAYPPKSCTIIGLLNHTKNPI